MTSGASSATARDLVPVCVREPLTAAAACELLRHSTKFTVVPRARVGEAAVALLSTASGSADLLRSLADVRRAGCAHVVVIAEGERAGDLVATAEPGRIAVVSHAGIASGGLEPTLAAVVAGESALPPGATWLSPGERFGADLDDRERDLLRGLADGLTLDEIARTMRYSDRTLKYVLHDVASRLGLRNRTQAVAYAIRSGAI